MLGEINSGACLRNQHTGNWSNRKNVKWAKCQQFAIEPTFCYSMFKQSDLCLYSLDEQALVCWKHFCLFKTTVFKITHHENLYLFHGQQRKVAFSKEWFIIHVTLKCSYYKGKLQFIGCHLSNLAFAGRIELHLTFKSLMHIIPILDMCHHNARISFLTHTTFPSY